MKIKARLMLNTYISVGAIILMMLSLAWSFLEAYRAEQNVRLTDELRKAVIETISLRDDYLLYREDRARVQWYSKSETFLGLLKSARERFVSKEDRALLDNAQKDFDATFSSFSEIMEKHKPEERSARRGFVLDEAELRLMGQILLKSYALSDDIEMLHESAERVSIAARNKGVIFIFVFIMSGVTAMVINSAFVSRILAKRLVAIDEGIRIIGGGNLDFRIDTTGDDELSDLALASNEMAAKLRDSYTSVENLKREITERKRAEQRYRDLFESSRDGIVHTNMQGRIQDANAAYIDMLGYSKEEILLLTYQQLTPSKWHDAEGEIVRSQIILRGYSDEYEKEYIKKDGTLFPIILRTWLMTNEHGSSSGMWAMVRDITERKRAEEALRQSEQKYRDIFNATSDALGIHDVTGKFLDVNEQMCAMFQYDRATALGLSLNDLSVGVSPYSEAEAFEKFRRSIEEGPQVFEWQSRRSSGEIFWCEVALRSYRIGGEMCVVASARDITARKLMEEQQRQWEQQRQQLLKAESLSRMAGAIAHHFNNMLGAVIGNLELASIGLPQGSVIHDHLIAAMEASGRAAEISRSMLAYLGQTTSERESIDLTETTSEALLLLGASLPKKVHLEINLPPEEVMIPADTDHIKQILTNLVLNASEAIGEQEGFISVAIHPVAASDIPESRFFPSEWKPAAKSYACLSVSDTGCGIDAVTQETIFDPFYSTKFAGRGLGLAVAMGLVRAHEGAIALESRVGWGSSFRLYLPMSEIDAQPPSQDEKLISKIIEGQGLVLLVEDEPMVRNMAESMLKRLGYEVTTACDGSEAVDIFRERKYEFGLVLLDLNMPRMGGWETLSVLRTLRPDIPVVLASGYDEAQVMQGYHPERPQAFLHKPYRMKDLRAVLVRCQIDSAR
jgi:two-component system, cell cycle sensor histidine kinase and response regulator CckA